MKFVVYIVRNDGKERLMGFDNQEAAQAWVDNYNENSRHKRTFEIIEE